MSRGTTSCCPTRWRSLRPTLRIRQYSSLDAAAQSLSKYEVAVSRKGEQRLGDVLRICRVEKYYNADGFATEPAPEDVTTLTVTALADTEPFGSSVDIYVSDELYADIIATEPLTGIEIALTEPAMNAQVEEALLARFTGAEYQLTNRQSGADFFAGNVLRRVSPAGIYLLGALSLYPADHLCPLCDYIEGSRRLSALFTGSARQRGRCISHIYGRPGFPPQLPLPRRF